MNLTRDEKALIVESLRRTRLVFESYPYPNERIRAEQLAAVDHVIAEIRKLAQPTVGGQQ